MLQIVVVGTAALCYTRERYMRRKIAYMLEDLFSWRETQEEREKYSGGEKAEEEGGSGDGIPGRSRF